MSNPDDKPIYVEAMEVIVELKKQIAVLTDQRTHEIEAKNKTIQKLQRDRDAIEEKRDEQTALINDDERAEKVVNNSSGCTCKMCSYPRREGINDYRAMLKKEAEVNYDSL